MQTLDELLTEIRACQVCKDELPLGPNPIVRAHHESKLLIVGQAPGTKVHNTSIPWNDPSGNKLREWLNIDKDVFYDETKIAIVPMGYCYPGRGKSGDLPPRKECAELYLDRLLRLLPNIKLTLLIGQYAQEQYLGDKRKRTLTETVRAFEEYIPQYICLPHPSPRNNIWLKRNNWFEELVIPYLRERVKKIL